MNVELYIAGQLCDLEKTDLGIRLKRQFFNPKEFSSKDTQKSYNITLPATPRNNEIFRQKNIEETIGKFMFYPDARLYVDGILVLEGRFRLTEISRNSYKGNLGVPIPLTAKDVFGDMSLSNTGTWKIENFRGFRSISDFNTDNYNKQEFGEVAPCIFPLVLYGLLPKKESDVGNIDNKVHFDDGVVLDLKDFVPSINCLQMLKKIFSNSGYELSGTAFDDERLTHLYMSYKNPNDYEFDWGTNIIKIDGTWQHYIEALRKFENKFKENEDEKQYVTNIFNSRNHIPIIKDDIGSNVSMKDENITIIIPRTGLYKMHLKARIAMLEDKENRVYPNMGVKSGKLDSAPIEIHLVKNFERDLSEVSFLNKFYQNNIEIEMNSDNAIFPQPNYVNFIDPMQEPNFLCGFAFGKHWDEHYINPLNLDYCNPMAISGGRSWNFDNGNGVTDRTFSVVNSPYYKFNDQYRTDSNRFKVDLRNAETKTKKKDEKIVEGDLHQIVWLNKGDKLNLLIITKYMIDSGIDDYKPFIHKFIYGCDVSYSLEIEPFQHSLNWLKMNADGSSIDGEFMDWNDDSTFVKDTLDLIKALPSEIKVNDWIDNFCKVFNLALYDDGSNRFSLNIKGENIVRDTSIVIDLDSKASVSQLSNEPLNLPYTYELGFTVDTDEEGYYSSISEDQINEQGEKILTAGDTGGGIFKTGSTETGKITQISNFSYCWYKQLYEDEKGKVPLMNVPVITDREVWENDYDYKEMIDRRYFNKSQRFWYKSGAKELNLGLGRRTTVVLVSNEYNGANKLRLDYEEDNPNSILRNYFMLLTNEKEYTCVECFLTPQEYEMLGRAYVRFNGDIYNVAEADGFDLSQKSKTKLKLIKKVQ